MEVPFKHDTDGLPSSIHRGKLCVEEFTVPADASGIELYIRNKRPFGSQSFRSKNIVLFVHGATFPASTSFDLALGGFSWMDYIASRGFDVYLLDLRGYGRSTRPVEMIQDPQLNPPIVNGATALRDISTAITFILNRRNVSKLNLIGWSWGATLMAAFAARAPSKVERLIQYGPPWICVPPNSRPRKISAYRTLTRQQVEATWFEGVPQHRKADLMPPDWFEAWIESTWASDPMGARGSPPFVRAPNGVLQDICDFHGAGKPYYDPTKITAPTLLIFGQWDRDTPPYMARTLFLRLTNSPFCQIIELAESTHHVMLERNRLALFSAVQNFMGQEFDIYSAA
jgi:pimeloyl-ACP methyl ester carboxylesterase